MEAKASHIIVIYMTFLCLAMHVLYRSILAMD